MTPGIGFEASFDPTSSAESTMASARKVAPSSPDWTSPTDAAPFDRWRGEGARRAVLAALAAALCLHPSQLRPKGSAPFPYETSTRSSSWY